jgi:hypothetical protein
MDFGVLLFWLFLFVLGSLFALWLLSKIGKFYSKQLEAMSKPEQATEETGETNEESEDLTTEDSEGDGLMLFDDPMFPPDSDDD